VTPADTTTAATDLRRRRQTLELSPAALAGALGVHPASVLRWERRERLPGPAHIRRLAAALDLSTPQVAGFFDAARAPAPVTGVRGHGLRAIRATAGRSAAVLAAAAAVPVSTVYNWEAGRSRIPDRHLAPLADALGLEPAALCDLLRRAPAGRPVPPLPTSPLRRLRCRRGLTQDAAARHVGVSRHTLGGWERGTRLPLHALRRLAATYGVPVGAVAEAAGVPAPRELDPRAWRSGDLPHVLRALRAWSGLTQREVAATCGCSVEAVRSWERGRGGPRTASRRRLEELYRLSPGALSGPGQPAAPNRQAIRER